MARNNAIYVIAFLIVITVKFDSVRARPAEELAKPNNEASTKSIDRKDELSPSRWERGMELLGRVGDALRFGRGKLINSAMLTRNIIAERAEGLASETRNNVASIIAAKNDLIAQGSTAINSLATLAPLENILSKRDTQERVKLESENAQSLFEFRKANNPIGNVLESYLRPKPLLDRIREDEKYGNSGDRFIGIGRALVGGFEGLSNFLNTVVDFPVDAAKKTSRGFSKALNDLGGRLIGLQ